MIDPLPTVLITVPPPAKGYSGVSARNATIKQADGKDFPLYVSRMNINIDYNCEPVTVDLTAVGGFAAEVAAGVRTIEIDGEKYHLVKSEPPPGSLVRGLYDENAKLSAEVKTLRTLLKCGLPPNPVNADVLPPYENRQEFDDEFATLRRNGELNWTTFAYVTDRLMVSQKWF